MIRLLDSPQRLPIIIDTGSSRLPFVFNRFEVVPLAHLPHLGPYPPPIQKCWTVPDGFSRIHPVPSRLHQVWSIGCRDAGPFVAPLLSLRTPVNNYLVRIVCIFYTIECLAESHLDVICYWQCVSNLYQVSDNMCQIRFNPISAQYRTPLHPASPMCGAMPCAAGSSRLAAINSS